PAGASGGRHLPLHQDHRGARGRPERPLPPGQAPGEVPGGPPGRPLTEGNRRSVMQVKEIMTRGVEVIHPDSTVEEAARKMKDLDIGPLPVCEDDRLVGMLTDRDITLRSTAGGEDPTRDKVRDVMTREVIYCFDDEDVAVAARQMKQ